jgi:hypothetical protein
MELFADEDVFSRFLINPIRKADPPVGSRPSEPVWTGEMPLHLPACRPLPAFSWRTFASTTFNSAGSTARVS